MKRIFDCAVNAAIIFVMLKFTDPSLMGTYFGAFAKAVAKEYYKGTFFI